MIKKVVESVLNVMCPMFFKVYAADGEQPTPEVAEAPTTNEEQFINFENLIARARKEEKDKLYPKITSLENEVKVLTKRNNELLVLAENAKAEAEEAKKLLAASGKDDSDKVKALKAEVEEARKKFEELAKTMPKIEDVEAMVRAEYEVKLYREEKLREAGNTIIPELVDGKTKEEIDASIVGGAVRIPGGRVFAIRWDKGFVPASVSIART